MLMAILEFRARVCELYQKLQLLIDPIFKFLLSFLVIIVHEESTVPKLRIKNSFFMVFTIFYKYIRNYDFNSLFFF